MAQNTCIVVFSDGTQCHRSPDGRSVCCALCRDWSRKHDGGDPNGRRRVRRNGTLLADIRALSKRDTDDCVILPGYSTRPKVDMDGTQVSASRAAWIMEHGTPGEDWILHTCHQGEDGCVNLRHLYRGDPLRNNRDREEAGRGQRGKILAASAEQVAEIRRRYVKGNRWQPGNRLELAAEFGISEKTIRHIIGGRRRSVQS